MAYAGKLSIGTLILMFVAYIMIHIAIGLQKTKKEDKVLALTNKMKGGESVFEPEITAAKKEEKLYGLAFKFFPIVYLIFVMVYLYMQ